MDPAVATTSTAIQDIDLAIPIRALHIKIWLTEQN